MDRRGVRFVLTTGEYPFWLLMELVNAFELVLRQCRAPGRRVCLSGRRQGAFWLRATAGLVVGIATAVLEVEDDAH
jgi:hypothetical protein